MLGRPVIVDPHRQTVTVSDGRSVRVAWAVLTVHYLGAEPPEEDAREVSFSYFQDCRTYLSVFGKRIVGRFLATVGRTAGQFERAAARVGGVRLGGPGTGYGFQVFPRLPVAILRFEGDEEVGPGASVLYRADAQGLLPAEDRVVAAELVLDALAGKAFEEIDETHEKRN